MVPPPAARTRLAGDRPTGVRDRGSGCVAPRVHVRALTQDFVHHELLATVDLAFDQQATAVGPGALHARAGARLTQHGWQLIARPHRRGVWARRAVGLRRHQAPAGAGRTHAADAGITQAQPL